MAASNRTYVGGSFALDLEGAGMGFLESVDGGNVFAEVITNTLGQDKFKQKHIGPPQHEDFTVEIGFSLADAMYKWIANSWTGNPERKSGSVIAIDNKLRSVSQRDFSDALITETTIPTLDGASKDPALLTVKFSPADIRSRKSSGSDVGKAGKEKKALCSNFRLEIDGLECKRVSKIESFTVKRTVANDDPGGLRDVQMGASDLDFPNLKISVSEADAQSWIDWADDFIVKGNNSNANEKTGALILLTPNMKTELARVSFFNLGICRLAPQQTERDAIRRLKAELYCERMELKVS